ncbi:hypothetical protein AIIKEEIJ_06223 [Rhodococcus sp. YH1]|nr:hypothetical protein [Rhodococcus sp. YH1]NCL78715.1 hypothetical protein [Rhodococcus sp. YH1]
MQRSRTIAGSPVRTAADAWSRVVQLLADTLERSSAVPEGSVAASLDKLQGIGSALAAGGYLDQVPLVLVDDGMYVSIRIVRGDNAFTVEENLDPIPGGASATNGWMLHIPSPDHLEGALESAAADNEHVSTAPAPTYQAQARTPSTATIDATALRRVGGN